MEAMLAKIAAASEPPFDGCQPPSRGGVDRFTALSTSSCHGVVEAAGRWKKVSRQNSLSSTKSTKSTPDGGLRSNKNNNKKGGGGGLAQNRRNSWMQSSVVRRAASVVDEEVAALCEKSPFLNGLNSSNNNNNNSSTESEPAGSSDNANASSSSSSSQAQQIAVFHRLEVELGKALGKGGFADVFAVAGLNIEEDEQDQDPIVVRRRECEANSITSSGRPAYAIKFLRKKLLSNTREFQLAAIDICVEATYLAALNHPNIVKIRGLTRGGTSAFRTGKHDDYFIIMDHLQETLERRIQRWQIRHNDDADANDDGLLLGWNNTHLKLDAPASNYYHRSLKYAEQIASALAYLHEKSIVYRDLKPQNLGFRERDTIQIFDFGLCRELPKPKGQSYREDNLEEEETFHMSGVGTQRYMAPEILNTRRYNLKADVYSWSMVVLEMMSWKKPFSEYTPEEHQFNVAQWGERPYLVTVLDKDNKDNDVIDEIVADDPAHEEEKVGDDKKTPSMKRKRASSVLVKDWPAGLTELVQQAWTQDVGDRLSIQTALKRLEPIVVEHTARDRAEKAAQVTHIASSQARTELTEEGEEIDFEFPSHFSPIHSLSAHTRQQHYHEQKRYDILQRQHITRPGLAREDSDGWSGDRQSETSTSLQELTMTSASTTMHDSISTTS